MLCISLQVLQEFGVKYILNVTTKCPNYFEGEKEFVYKRIAAIDTGTQKLSQHFSEAFEFIGKCIRVHAQRAVLYAMYILNTSVFTDVMLQHRACTEGKGFHSHPLYGRHIPQRHAHNRLPNALQIGRAHV